MNSTEITKVQITQLLNSKSIENQITAIFHIRNLGDKDLLRSMLDLLLESTNSDVEREILRCLCDIKDATMLPIIIETTQNPRFESKKRILLNTLWQTNFDVYAYIDYFVSLIITDSFEIGIEALTLLEIAVEDSNSEQKSAIKSLLHQALTSSSESQKTALLMQAVDIVSEQ